MRYGYGMTQTNAQAAIAAAALVYSGIAPRVDVVPRDVINMASEFLSVLESWSPTLADAQPVRSPQDTPGWGTP